MILKYNTYIMPEMTHCVTISYAMICTATKTVNHPRVTISYAM